MGHDVISTSRCAQQWARGALRKADEWIEEQKRKAEDNALLRIQYEMLRPTIEALRQEAENLIEGKDPAGDRVGITAFRAMALDSVEVMA